MEQAPCSDGETRCEGAAYLVCKGGAFTQQTVCGAAQPTCIPNYGCGICLPGTATCNGSISEVCRPDGRGYEHVTCDSALGLTCSATGFCEGPCAPATLGPSYIGCEYYPTIT